MKEKRFFLIDLERTLKNGVPFYWRTGGRGYTPFVREAGLYSAEEAKREVETDIEGLTVSIEGRKAEKLVLGLN